MNQRRHMRIVATLAATAVLAIGVSGCSLDPRVHATTRNYSPAEGINVPGFGDVTVRNVLFVANDEGTEGKLVAALVNRGTTEATVDFDVVGATVSVPVPANSIVSLGTAEHEAPQVTLKGTETRPGADVAVTVFVPGQEAETIQAPIVDGTLPYFAEIAP